MQLLDRIFVALTLPLIATAAYADDYKNDWMGLATQTCVAQAPNNAYISKLNMGRNQLQYSCQCVARDMMKLLPENERTSLLRQMRQKQNMQAVGERMFERAEVKNAALMCSAAFYWQR